MTVQVMTANRLADGAVVYLGDGGWVLGLGEARLLEDEAAVKAAEARATADEAACVVTGGYVIEVERAAGSLRAVSFRERIRARGPTSEPWVGKQADDKKGSAKP